MTDVRALLERIDELEARVAALEHGASPSGGARAQRRGSGGEGRSVEVVDASGWSRAYEPAELEVSETWIELHEQSARPQLQRLVRRVVEVEGPVTERLALDRVRRAWGLKRAGGRVQEAFDQTVRQLVARGIVERSADALVTPGQELDAVRVPTEDEATRRGAEDVPLAELALALRCAVEGVGGSGPEDELTMAVAKLLGWTRRGGAIQTRFDAAIDHAVAAGILARDAGRIRLP